MSAERTAETIKEIVTQMKNAFGSDHNFKSKEDKENFQELYDQWKSFFDSVSNAPDKRQVILDFAEREKKTMRVITECIVDPANDIYGKNVNLLLNDVVKTKNIELMGVVRKLGSFSPLTNNKEPPPIKETIHEFRALSKDLGFLMFAVKAKMKKVTGSFLKHEPLFQLAYQLFRLTKDFQEQVEELRGGSPSQMPPRMPQPQFSQPPQMQPQIPPSQPKQVPPPPQFSRPQVPPQMPPRVGPPRGAAPLRPIGPDPEEIRLQALDKYRLKCKEELRKRIQKAIADAAIPQPPEGFTTDLSGLQETYNKLEKEREEAEKCCEFIRNLPDGYSGDGSSAEDLKASIQGIKSEIQELVNRAENDEKSFRQKHEIQMRAAKTMVMHMPKLTNFVNGIAKYYQMEDAAPEIFAEENVENVSDFQTVNQTYDACGWALHNIYSEKVN
ncbi:hypothetical protein GPJ56_002141 [Histomonas meleagridis]|uniref:uncharacterized protein n=1 Tax=Histomonas meleagridis TaxID=135588 RepID=UPI00355A0CA9|nr:hypothetical protein GPJ56_002141 [Histomonas meleagridis]KAH0806680.1 hypothetical protein GO595_000531 [Histomonas meleagridis]